MRLVTKPFPGVFINPLHPLARGLIACWLFNTGTGNQVWDYSFVRNHGILTQAGGVWVFNGLSFSGVGKVNIGSLNGISSTYVPYTFSIWAKLNAVDGSFDEFFRLKGADNSIWVYSDGDFGYGNLNNPWQRWNVNAWTDHNNFHLITVVSIADGQAEIYFDGVSQGLKTTGLATEFPFSNVEIGFNFDGIFSRILIHDHALSAFESKELYFNPDAMFQTVLDISVLGAIAPTFIPYPRLGALNGGIGGSMLGGIG